jgi:hypothetical protein
VSGWGDWVGGWGDWVGERAREWVSSEWVGGRERVGDRVGKRESGWVGERVCGWRSEWVSEWVGERGSGWVDVWASGWVSKWAGGGVSGVLQALHLAWTAVPLNYKNATVASLRRLLPENLIVAHITNKLLSAHPNQRIVSVFTSCHGLQLAILLRSVLILFGHLVYFRLFLLFRVFDQNSVNISHLFRKCCCPAPPLGLQSLSMCSSAGSTLCSKTFRLCETRLSLGGGHKCKSSGVWHRAVRQVCAGVSYEHTVPNDGISRFFGNFSTYIPDCTAWHVRRWSRLYSVTC